MNTWAAVEIGDVGARPAAARRLVFGSVVHYVDEGTGPARMLIPPALGAGIERCHLSAPYGGVARFDVRYLGTVHREAKKERIAEAPSSAADRFAECHAGSAPVPGCAALSLIPPAPAASEDTL